MSLKVRFIKICSIITNYSFFCYIALYLDVHKLGMVFESNIHYDCFFIWELVVKPDLLNAYLDFDLNYFITSGGTYFYSDVRDRSSGLTLFAQENVFAYFYSSYFLVSLFSKNELWH